jgi:hypothetical protein
MTVTVVAALALAGCSNGVGEKGDAGPAGPPGDKGEKGDTGGSRHNAQGRVPTVLDCLLRNRRDYDQCLLHRHIQCLSAGAAGKRRAVWQQSQFDHSVRNDRVRKTLVDLVRPPQLAPLVISLCRHPDRAYS